jgi:hypothetical protein
MEAYMGEYIVEELNMMGAYNSNRYIFESIKSNIKCNGIIIFPIDIKNIDIDKYNNDHYQIGKCFGGTLNRNGVTYTSNSLSLLLIDEANLLDTAKLICDRFNQNICILKDNINNNLFRIKRDDTNDICN